MLPPCPSGLGFTASFLLPPASDPLLLPSHTPQNSCSQKVLELVIRESHAPSFKDPCAFEFQEKRGCWGRGAPFSSPLHPSLLLQLPGGALVPSLRLGPAAGPCPPHASARLWGQARAQLSDKPPGTMASWDLPLRNQEQPHLEPWDCSWGLHPGDIRGSTSGVGGWGRRGRESSRLSQPLGRSFLEGPPHSLLLHFVASMVWPGQAPTREVRGLW